jgi:hypothetical protein
MPWVWGDPHSLDHVQRQLYAAVHMHNANRNPASVHDHGWCMLQLHPSTAEEQQPLQHVFSALCAATIRRVYPP